MKKTDLTYLFYLPSFSGGGSEMVTINLANQFYSNKKKIIFLCSNNNGPLFFKLNKNIKVINLKKKRLLFSIFKIIEVIKKEKPNVIFSSLVHSNIFFCIIKKYINIKFFLLIRHGNIANIDSNLKNKIKHYLFSILIKIFYKYSDILVSSGNLTKIYLNSVLGLKKQIVSLNNPVFTRQDFIRQINTKNKWVQKNKYNYILSIGRLSFQKNYIFLIKSFINLKLSKKNKLLIIGEGDQYNFLKKFIKQKNLAGKIKIIKFQKNPLKYIYFCKCFVLSSLWEGQSNVLLQAALLKKKIICADTAGDVKYLNKKFRNINIYKSNNYNDFKKKIISTLNYNYKDTKNKFHKCSKDFDIKAITKKYIRIIDEKI